MMLEEEVDDYIYGLIQRIHSELVDHFQGIISECSLTEEQDSMLRNLDQQSPRYKQLTALLAIEFYMKRTVSLFCKSEPILEVFSLLLSHMTTLHEELEQFDTSERTVQIYNQIWRELSIACEITHEMFPRSPMVAIHEELIRDTTTTLDAAETIYSRLRYQNQELKQKLEMNDRVIAELELQLTKILQEQEQTTDKVEPTMKIIDLREIIQERDQEIARMNAEFQSEIEKYNVVYDAMKREIENLKSYSDVDLVAYVQRLEMDVVKLREEAKGDERLIKELRTGVYQPIDSYSIGGNLGGNMGGSMGGSIGGSMGGYRAMNKYY